MSATLTRVMESKLHPGLSIAVKRLTERARIRIAGRLIELRKSSKFSEFDAEVIEFICDTFDTVCAGWDGGDLGEYAEGVVPSDVVPYEAQCEAVMLAIMGIESTVAGNSDASTD